MLEKKGSMSGRGWRIMFVARDYEMDIWKLVLSLLSGLAHRAG